jgi:hypothetical protein
MSNPAASHFEKPRHPDREKRALGTGLTAGTGLHKHRVRNLAFQLVQHRAHVIFGDFGVMLSSKDVVTD